MKWIRSLTFQGFSLLMFSVCGQAIENKATFHLNNPGLLWQGAIDEGLLIARPIELKKNGYFLKTWELIVNPGLGSDTVPYSYSILKTKIYQQIHALPLGVPYIFHYKKSVLNNRLTQFWRNTPYEIIDVFPVHLTQEDWISELPLEYSQPVSHSLEYASGHISGILMKVQQWGRFWSSCTLTLHQGGTKFVERSVKHSWLESLFLLGTEQFGKMAFTTAPLSERYLKPVLNTVKINAGSQAMCQYAEAILPFGRKLNVQFSQAYTETYDYSRLASRIRVLDAQQ